MKFPISIFPAVLLVVLVGCQTRQAAFLDRNTTKYSIESTGKFRSLDDSTRRMVRCTGLQERIDDEGRLRVVANVKNRTAQPIQIQAKCVFQNASGFAIGDETAWQTLELGEDATRATQYRATNGLARRYTIVLRQAP